MLTGHEGARALGRVRRDCDEEDGCDAFIQSPPHPFWSKGFATRRALNRGSFTWPGQLAARAIFSPLAKTMALVGAPQAALSPPGHGVPAHAGIGGERVAAST